MFWRSRFFVLNGESITYWASQEARDSGVKGASFSVAEVDDVQQHGQQVVLHFAQPVAADASTRSRVTLVLFLSGKEEATEWAENIASVAARRVRHMLPSGWDVGTMLRTNTGSSARRVAKVELPPEALAVLQHLVDHAFICKRTRDRRGDEVPVKIEVTKVVSVQNVAAWMAYAKAKDDVRDRMEAARSEIVPLCPEVMTSSGGSALTLGHLDEMANEQWLFHGTRVEAAQGITDSEFRMDLAGSHRGSMYGKAVYLAECSSKADEYSEADEEGICRMLLCRATLGSVLVEREKAPSAPELMEQCKQKYDSLCGDRWAAVGTFREFVLYQPSQVYPEYIIYYKRIMQTELLSAISAASAGNDLDGMRKLVPHAARLAQTHPDWQSKYRISLLLGAHANTVVPALTECLKDDTPLQRRTAAAALGNIAEFTANTMPSGGSIMTEEHRDKERGVVVASAVPGLVECLSDSNEGVRRAAAQAIEQIGPAAAFAVPALARCLADSSEDVRCAAAKALERMGGDVISSGSRSAVPALAAALKDSNISVRKAAIAALGRLGSAVQPALPALIECLQNTDHSVRRAAAKALENLGPFAASSVPSLLACLEDKDVGVRTVAAAALGVLGCYSHSSQLSEALCERMLDTHEGVRVAAAVSLGRLGQPSTVPVLTEGLKDTNEDVRKAVATALGQMREVAVPAIPQLIKALKDSNENVRTASATSLGLFGPAAADALPALISAMSETTHSVRKAAASALGLIGQPSAAAIKVLQERIKDPNEGVRKAARKSFEALERLQEEKAAEAKAATAEEEEEEDGEEHEELDEGEEYSDDEDKE